MNKFNPEIFTKVVKAGKRIYFVDVRSTKNTSEPYITITEKKRNEIETEKFKIFLYKEDFEKFLDALKEAIDFAKNNLNKENKS